MGQSRLFQNRPVLPASIEVARQIDDPTTLAHSLNRLGNWHLNMEHPADAHSYHQKALTVFERLQDRHGIAETLDFLGMASYLGGNLTQGTLYYEQAVALCRELDERWGLSSSLTTLTMRGPTYQTDTLSVPVVGLADTAPEGQLALKIARETRQPSDEASARNTVVPTLIEIPPDSPHLDSFPTSGQLELA